MLAFATMSEPVLRCHHRSGSESRRDSILAGTDAIAATATTRDGAYQGTRAPASRDDGGVAAVSVTGCRIRAWDGAARQRGQAAGSAGRAGIRRDSVSRSHVMVATPASLRRPPS